MPLYRRLPKRGFKSIQDNNIAILNLSKIQNIIEKSKYGIKNSLDLKILKEKKLIHKKFKKLKILGTGEIKSNIEILAHFASKQALDKIEIKVPLVIRLAGTNVDKGNKILRESKIKYIEANSLEDAANKAVKILK